MPFTQYHDISAFDLSTLHLNDIRWLVGTGQRMSTRQGKKQKTAYRRGVLTPIGDVRLDVWYELTEAIIRRDGEQPLLNSLVEWLSAHNYAEEAPTQIHYHALELHSSRLFDRPQWVDYIPFNRLYSASSAEWAALWLLRAPPAQQAGEREQLLTGAGRPPPALHPRLHLRLGAAVDTLHSECPPVHRSQKND